MANPTTNADLPPVAPLQPDIDDCCRSGCDPCIFDLYEDAMARYRLQLQAWEAGKIAIAAKNTVKQPAKKAVAGRKIKSKSSRPKK